HNDGFRGDLGEIDCPEQLSAGKFVSLHLLVRSDDHPVASHTDDKFALASRCLPEMLAGLEIETMELVRLGGGNNCLPLVDNTARSCPAIGEACLVGAQVVALPA